jgi:hypothetical protein
LGLVVSLSGSPVPSARRQTRFRAPTSSHQAGRIVHLAPQGQPALQKAARAVVDSKRIALVVVGDRAKVESPLKA